MQLQPIRLNLFACFFTVQGAEPVQPSPEPGLQGARRPAARHGARRLLERRAHPDRDRQLAVSTRPVCLHFERRKQIVSF